MVFAAMLADEYIIFPEKVKKAKEDFEKFGLPDLKKHSC